MPPALRPKRLTLLIAVLCLLAAGVGVWWHQEKNVSAQVADSAPARAVSVANAPAPAPLPMIGNRAFDPRHEPAELRGGRLIESRQIPASNGKPAREVALYETGFKYPLLRVERELKKDQPAWQSVMVGDHVLVRALAGVDARLLSTRLAARGASVRRQIPGTDLYLVALREPGIGAYDRLLADLGRERDVLAYAEPDYVVHHMAAPNDPQFPQQWHLHNTGQGGGTVDADIDAPEAWSINMGSSDVVVAVIDTGMDLTHPDLIANLWANPGESGGGKETDGIDNDGNGYADDVHGWNFVTNTPAPMDDNGHGTHTGGTVGAAGGNAIGVTGVCQQVSLMPLKFLNASGSGANSDAIEAVRYATAHGVLLTSNSWGGSGFSQAMLDAIEEANAAGVGFVAACGNSGISNDIYPEYPANFAAPNVISVAATDRNDALVWFSNFGAQRVHLAAAGLQTLSTGLGGTYTLMSGTSMAAPQVSGAAALLKAANPALPFSRIKSMLLARTDAKPSLTGKTSTGGRLNAASALEPALAPFLRFASFIVDDSAGGNGDGIASPGETVRLIVTVENLGAFDAEVVQGVLSLAAPASGFTLSAASADYGTLSAGLSRSNDSEPFEIVIASGFTPKNVALNLTLTDSAARQWLLPLTLKVRTVATLSGSVTRLTGGDPVAGAVIEVTGPETFTAHTESDGTYSLVVTNGQYQIKASAPGFVPSVPVTRTLPPSATGVNFVLGYSESDVQPAQLSAAQAQDGITTQTLTLHNSGDQPLTYRILEVPPPAPQALALPPVTWAAGAPEPTPPVLATPGARSLPALNRLFDASDNTAATLPHYESFEDGLWGRWWESWGNGTRQVINGGAPSGSRSFRFDFDGPNDHFTGIHQIFQGGTQPGYIGFWIQPGPTYEATAYMVLLDLYLVLDQNGLRYEIADFIWFFANANGRFYLNDDVGGNQAVQYQEGQWYRVEFRDINWQAKHLDYWVNGQLVQENIPFRNPAYASGLAYALTYNYSGGTSMGLDDLIFAGDELPWLRLSTQQGSVPAGGSVEIEVTFDSDRLAAGTYTGALQIQTNDPQTAALEVPVSLAVSALPNHLPLAHSQSVLIEPGAQHTITLSAEDADDDTLTYRVTRLPDRGTLYQTDDGVTPGAALAHTPRVVSDSAHRLIFIPDDSDTASPYASFDFQTADRWAQSAPALVTLTTGRQPLLYISPEGAATSDPVTVTLSSDPEDAVINFTTDGSDPDSGAAHTAASGFQLRIDRALTLRALAQHDGLDSEPQTHLYDIADSDSNGLPDWWEALHPAAAVAGVIDPALDADQDGLSNGDEFILGTDPAQPDTWQPALSPTAPPTLAWPSLSGRLYTVEKSGTDPLDLAPVTTPPLWGTGGVMEWQDDDPPPAAGFYRLRVSLP